MKKIMMGISLIFLMMLLLTGCGHDPNKEAQKIALETQCNEAGITYLEHYKLTKDQKESKLMAEKMVDVVNELSDMQRQGAMTSVTMYHKMLEIPDGDMMWDNYYHWKHLKAYNEQYNSNLAKIKNKLHSMELINAQAKEYYMNNTGKIFGLKEIEHYYSVKVVLEGNYSSWRAHFE